MNPKKVRQEIQAEVKPQFGVIKGGSESTDDRGDLVKAPQIDPNETSRDINDAEGRFGVIQGGGESTDDRGNLRLQEADAGQQVANQFKFDETNNRPQRTTLLARAGKIAKKRGPLAFIGGILGGAFALIAFFGGPSLLIVHMSEIFGDALDQQHPVLETRYRKVTIAKLENKTSGLCGSLISARCKYSTFSEKELQNRRANGQEVVDKDGKPLLDENNKLIERGRPAAAIKFEGKTIPATEYNKALRTNPGFRNSSIKSLNTKFIGLFDNKFNDYFTRVKASKSSPYKDAKSDEDRDKTLNETTKNGAPIEKKPRITESADCENQQCIDDENRRIDEANKLADEAEKNAEDNIRSAKPGTLTKVLRAASPVSAVNDLCDVPRAIDAVGIGAKVIRNAQMVRYASTFLALASMIKAGDAKAEDIAFAGMVLTKVVADAQGNLSKSATDSFAFRNAANGDKGVTESAGLAMGGGMLGGGLENVRDKIYGSIPGGKSTCKTLNNPIVGGGLAAASLVPGVKAGGLAVNAALKAILASVFKSAVAGIGLSMMLDYVIDIGIDMVSGVGADSKNMYGELAGDWIGSGTDEMFAGANGMGGALPLSPSQAVALQPNNNQLIAEYRQSQTSSVNPLDPNSSYSLVGMTYQSLLKSTGIINTASSALLAPQKLFGSALGMTTKNASAVGEADYQQCKDNGYLAAGVATTPLCHVVKGIPAEYINLDPNTVSDWLFEKGQVDETGAPVEDSDYSDFIDLCFQNNIVGADTGDGGDGNDCMIKDTDSPERQKEKGYYAVHYVDERLIDVAENGLPESTGGESPLSGAGDFTVATYNILEANSHTAKSKAIGGCNANPVPGDPTCGKTRAALQAQIITGTAGDTPQFDIFGTQETSPLQHAELRKLLPNYDTYPTDTSRMNNAQDGAVSIFWNTAKFTKIEEGKAPGVSNTSKDITNPWVGLQTAGGHKIYVMSIHYAISAYGGDPAGIRRSAQLTADWVKSKQGDGATVMVVGDFNDHPSEKLSYCVLTAGSLMQHAIDLQDGNPVNAGCSKVPRYDGIDHIYATPTEGLTAKGWKHPAQTGIFRRASDHSPSYVTYSLASESNTISDESIGWPVDKKFFDANKADWLGPHSANSGTWTNGIDSLADDISTPPDGTPVYAMFSGKVSRPDLGGHGLVISTNIQGGILETAYAHGPRADNNSQYKTGDKIMEIGNLGNSSGGHLHIDMSFNGKGVCPQDVFLAMAAGTMPDFNQLTRIAAAPCGRSG